MGTPTVEVKCPACGQGLRVVLASAPPTQWFPCPRCQRPVPVVVPRDLPPLYSWEVLPGLYPNLPPPRIPKWRARGAAAAALVVVTVVAAVFGGWLAYDGVLAAGPGSYTVSGTVARQTFGGPVPAAGALVVLTEEGNRTVRATLGPSGAFSFSNVPSGGISLNVTLTGYAPATVDTFASPGYDAGTTDLSITLVPGSSGNGTLTTLSPFPDLETFLAAIGGATVLLGIVALVAGFAALITVRADRPAVGVVGGGAGIAAPLVVHFLSLDAVFPIVLIGAAIAGAFGAFTLALRAVEMAQTGPAVEPDP